MLWSWILKNIPKKLSNWDISPSAVLAFSTWGADKEDYFSFGFKGVVNEESKGLVASNRDRLNEWLESVFNKENFLGLQWLDQVHGVECFEIKKDNFGATLVGDAMWTNETGLGLAVLSADCVPIILAREDSGSIGICHAGWKGLVQDVPGILAGEMTSCPSELSAWIGPSISQANYEIGPDVWKILEQIAPETIKESSDSDQKRLADLSLLSEILLRRAGVRNIFQSRLCTYDNAEAFSYRRAAKNNSQEALGARMATVVMRL